MNKQQKLAIENLRKENYSYAFIASRLELNPNTVKSYCYRHKVTTACDKRKNKTEKESVQICTNCGKTITNDWNRTNKRFCSDKCRTAYWNSQKARKAREIASGGPETIALEIPFENRPERTGLQAPPEVSSLNGR